MRDLAQQLLELRADALQLLAVHFRELLEDPVALRREAKVHGDTGDGAIRTRLSAELERQPWWRPATSNVIVTDGVVHYFGTLDSEEQRPAARVAAENVPGVRAVEDHRIPIPAIAWSV